jgi:fatty acid desaturase
MTTQSAAPTDAVDVRQALGAACPSVFQGLLTRLTGKALRGQELPARSGVSLLLQAVAWLMAGVAGATWLVVAGHCWIFLPLFWLMTVHGARVLQVQMAHQASHGTLVGTPGRPRPRSNRLLGQGISIALVVENFEVYRRAHLHDHHHPRRLSTDVDPTVRLLKSAGLRAGLSVGELWARLLGSLVSPLFHARRVLTRLCVQFRGAPPACRAASLLYLGALVSAVALTGHWAALLLAWFVPLFPLYEISATLRLAVEHEWPAESFHQAQGDVDHLAMTHAVFCGAAPPERGASPLAWAGWAVRMAGHGLARFLVLVGDTPSHDFHHRHPQDPDWANVIVLRQQELIEDEERGQQVYTERWGLLHAIHQQFRTLAAYKV